MILIKAVFSDLCHKRSGLSNFKVVTREKLDKKADKGERQGARGSQKERQPAYEKSAG